MNERFVAVSTVTGSRMVVAFLSRDVILVGCIVLCFSTSTSPKNGEEIFFCSRIVKLLPLNREPHPRGCGSGKIGTVCHGAVGNSERPRRRDALTDVVVHSDFIFVCLYVFV